MCVLYILFIFISVQSLVVWATPFVLIMFFSNRINNKNKKIIWAMLSNDAYAEMHMHIWAKWWIGSGWKMQYSYNGLMCVCVYEHVYYSTRSIVLHIVVMQTGIGEYSEKYQFDRCHFVFRSARSNCIMWIQSPCTNCYIDCWRWHSLLDYEKMYWAQSQKILHRFAWQNLICITQRPFTKNEDHHRSKTKAYHWFNRMDVI